MATVLDISLIGEFTSLFVVVLVFALIFAVLEFSKFLGEENRNLRAIIAFSLAIVTLFSPNMIRFILNIGPLFVMAFIMIVFVIMMLKLLGAEDKDFTAALKARNNVLVYWILGICLVLIIIAIGQTFGEDTLRMTDGNSGTSSSELGDVVVEQTGTEGNSEGADFDENVSDALFNPKVLGTMLLLIIGFFTVLLLGVTPKPN